MNKTLHIRTSAGAFSAYLARPTTQPAPAVVVLQEIFGVNADMRATCQELADRGFIAICPDLFWRQEPGLDLNSWSEAEWRKGLALYAAFDFDAGVSDILATIEAARELAGSTGKVGVMGFCLGGLMAYLTAARGAPDAAVSYYGGGIDARLDEAEGISAPLLLHLAEEDEFIPKDAQQRIRQSLARKGQATIHSYPGRHHAFARHNGVHYDAAAAKAANARTWDFLAARLA